MGPMQKHKTAPFMDAVLSLRLVVLDEAHDIPDGLDLFQVLLVEGDVEGGLEALGQVIDVQAVGGDILQGSLLRDLFGVEVELLADEFLDSLKNHKACVLSL